jgi:GTP-binding protein
VERTRLLAHLVEVEPPDGSDPAANYRTVRRELEAFGRGLAGRPELVVATKVDLLSPDRREGVLSRIAREVDRGVHPLSAATGEGVAAWLRAVARALADAPPAPDVPGRLPPPAPPPEDGEPGAGA